MGSKVLVVEFEINCFNETPSMHFFKVFVSLILFSIMLKPKVISQVLRQSLHNGIKAALIMTSEGSLISFAADNDKDATIYSAISANIWNTYKNKNNDTYTNFQFQILHCDEGIVFITGIGSMLLCLVGDAKVNLGILKAKAEALKGHLEEPLQQVAPYSDYSM
ncbi:unnamed protein product [Mucor hiemalis]